ncbi:SDR family NAD(P)-dependent oxidoreductase [Sphaerimonospora sp. CA-214678]|uniref:SDR family NAD(P)-dependent oxidoreductase n=1 Tax=Sphaerimonospora sp. CA-214678 TaxID=3240029 RepID=UPI003D900DDC
MTGRVAVVSGGIRGIGLALSARLGKLGYQVIALYRQNAAAAAKAAAAHPEFLLPRRADVSDPVAVRRVCADVLGEFGAPRVLVNNAGINRDRPFLELGDEDWDRVVGTNLSGVFYLTRALAPAMIADGGGVIVNVGATTAMRPRAGGANYCASKAGVLQLTKCLALELAPEIRVNCLIPGFTDTPEVVERYGLTDPERRAAVLDRIPQRRIGTAEDMADALEYLVGDASRYVTGQKLIVDGGNFMW